MIYIYAVVSNILFKFESIIVKLYVVTAFIVRSFGTNEIVDQLFSIFMHIIIKIKIKPK